MKGSDFIKVLRKVIREEVRTVVKEELKAIKPIIAERQVTPVQPRREQPKPKREYPLVALDGPLASILKETADSMYNNQEEWPDMNDGPLTSEFVPAANARQSMSTFSNDPTMAFVKDYSAVMKAADAIQQGKH